MNARSRSRGARRLDPGAWRLDPGAWRLDRGALRSDHGACRHFIEMFAARRQGARKGRSASARFEASEATLAATSSLASAALPRRGESATKKTPEYRRVKTVLVRTQSSSAGEQARSSHKPSSSPNEPASFWNRACNLLDRACKLPFRRDRAITAEPSLWIDEAGLDSAEHCCAAVRVTEAGRDCTSWLRRCG